MRKKKNTQDQNIKDQTPNINIHPSPSIMDNDDNNIYVDTNYKHYKATVRQKNKEFNLRVLIHQLKNHLYQNENNYMYQFIKNY